MREVTFGWLREAVRKEKDEASKKRMQLIE